MNKLFNLRIKNTTIYLTLGILLIIQSGTKVFSNSKQNDLIPKTIELRYLQLQAYKCANKNTHKTCKKTREIADPLMDNPLLSTVCKDAIWALIDRSKEAQTNNINRITSIESSAEQVARLCKSKNQKSSPFKKNNQNPRRT